MLEDTNQTLITNLLKNPKQIQKHLQTIDGSFIEYRLREMREKMHKELLSPPKLQTKKSCQFPMMVESVNRKAYQYINTDIGNIRKIAKQHEQRKNNNKHMQITPSVRKQSENQSNLSQAIVEKVVSEHGSGSIHPQQLSKKSQKYSQRFSSVINAVYSPFVAPSQNFMDPLSNTKIQQNKQAHLLFTSSARNMAALAQTGKISAWRGSLAYPTTVMEGASIGGLQRDTPKVDVEEVMRYTLADKNKRPESTPKRQKISNPFAKVPLKYQQE